MLHRPVEILLVEDSPADARLTREALMQGKTPKRINQVSDGAEAIDYVRRRGRFQNSPRPDLILLDLNLPKRYGLEVLREIKSDPTLRSITVIVLTTSQFPKDINMAYDLAANCYIVKPPELDQFNQVMRSIEEFWMSMASLPTGGSQADTDEQASQGQTGQSGASAHASRFAHSTQKPPVRIKKESYVAVRRPRVVLVSVRGSSSDRLAGRRTQGSRS